MGIIYARLVSHGTAQDPLNAVLEVEQQELLPNQVLPFMDRLSMAHSIEVRSPYLDYRIIEFANRLPGSMKIFQGINKYVHKLAVQGLVPEDLLNRPKEGFVQPIYTWMLTSLKPWVLDHSLERAPVSAWVFSGRPRGLHAQGALCRGRPIIRARLWNLIVLSDLERFGL